MNATVAELTAWANMRLTSSDVSCQNILTGLMEGERMRVLVEKLTGSVPKRLGSLEGLSLSQKITRVDWFIDALKQGDKLPHSMKISSQYFAQYSTDHDGPCDITNKTEYQPFYKADNEKILQFRSQKRAKQMSIMSPEEMILQLVNTQLKTIPEGKRLEVNNFEDLTDSKILCTLINSFVPGTFTTEVLLNDRWTINLALTTTTNLFRVETNVNSGVLNEGDDMGTSAFFTYFFMSGYQFSQAKAVINRLEKLQKQQEDLHLLIAKAQQQDEVKPSMSVLQTSPSKNDKKSKKEECKLERIMEEVAWLTTTYNREACEQWMKKASEVQAEARSKISQQMKQRFDVLSVPENTRGITIRDLCDNFVINLSLTGGNGFYGNNNKERLWSGRRMVARHKESGEFFDDFTGAIFSKASVREILGLHPTDVVEVTASSYPDYELFFESSSRNKILKSGDRFLYQVFPGTPNQCQRLLRQAAKTGDLVTVEKLVLFFKSNEEFVNSTDPETENTPLHLASRNGHFKVALHLLENGAFVNIQNKPGCTPFFLAVEGLHRNLSQLLIEWGAKIDIKNRISKTALEIIRNPELKMLLEKKSIEHLDMSKRLPKHDQSYLEQVINDHISGEKPMASINSRSVNGCTLLHWSAIFGSVTLTQRLLNQHINPDMRSSTGATPLHFCRLPEVAKIFLDEGADINIPDCKGNTPLHCICLDSKLNPQISELVTLLINSGGDIFAVNDDGYLAIHCASKQGHITILETILKNSKASNMFQMLSGEKYQTSGSLVNLSLENDHLLCAEWLIERGFSLKEGEAKKLCLLIFEQMTNLKDPIKLLQFLLLNGLDANATINKERSLLHYAAGVTTFPEMTDVLLENEAEVNAIDRNQMTPLFIACQQDNFYAAKRLLQKGADYSCCDVNGKTAFDFIKDYDEWMESGYFTQDTRARLKAYSWKHARLFIKSISQKIHSQTKIDT